MMIQSKLKCVYATKTIKGTGYHLDILIAGKEFCFLCHMKSSVLFV